MTPYVRGAIKVHCRSCRWRGSRVPQAEALKWGRCPKCQAVLERAATLAERQAKKAKAELEQLEGSA